MSEEERADRCYECGGYGDDYHLDENGELVCNCIDCPYFMTDEEASDDTRRSN